MDCKRNGRGAQVRATSWVFLLVPDKTRAGVFFIQPIRPDLKELPNSIIRGACKAVKDAARIYKKLIAAGSIDEPKALFAKTIEQKISERFGHLVPIEVIFEEELFRRAREGEFQLHVPEEREQRRQNNRLRAIQGHVRIPRCEEMKKSNPVAPASVPELATPVPELIVPLEPSAPCAHEPPAIVSEPQPSRPSRWVLEIIL